MITVSKNNWETVVPKSAIVVMERPFAEKQPSSDSRYLRIVMCSEEGYFLPGFWTCSNFEALQEQFKKQDIYLVGE